MNINLIKSSSFIILNPRFLPEIFYHQPSNYQPLFQSSPQTIFLNKGLFCGEIKTIFAQNSFNETVFRFRKFQSDLRSTVDSGKGNAKSFEL